MRIISRLCITGAVAAGFLLLAPRTARVHTLPPPALSDSEFWDIFTTMSEPGGSFLSDNFVSNEVSFQQVIPTLQQSLRTSGVYLGVGPEQNFTYIANLKPRLAIIFDIRRQNAMEHLLYKALFELSPTREEFVQRLFSRPMAHPGAHTAVGVLFDSLSTALPNDSAYRANVTEIFRTLVGRHGFAISSEDSTSIESLSRVFYEAGPDINYGYRVSGSVASRGMYPTYGELQAATNADSVPMAFLASDENYRTVRDLQLNNLIVPVVGDFAGPKAIRAVGQYLDERQLRVTAFYLSNVEQYLFRDPGAADRFYGNVATLPIDSTSTFIRSVPQTRGALFGGGNSLVVFGNSPGNVAGGVANRGVGLVRVTIVDSNGVPVIRMVQDSTGQQITRVLRDSSGAVRLPDSARARVLARQDSVAAATALGVTRARSDSTAVRLLSSGGIIRLGATAMSRGGLLASGLVSMRTTLDAFFAGKLATYQDVVAMTKTTGWTHAK